MKNIKKILIAAAFSSLSISSQATTITESLDAGDGWTWRYTSGGAFVTELGTAPNQLLPTSGNELLQLSQSADGRSSAIVKELSGLTQLQAGVTYTISADFGNSDYFNEFIPSGSFVPTTESPTSDRFAFGFYLASNGIGNGSEMRNYINEMLSDEYTTVTWVSNTVPTEGNWETWSYTITLSEESEYVGQDLYFAFNMSTRSLENGGGYAADNLNITFVPESSSMAALFGVLTLSLVLGVRRRFKSAA